MKANPHKLYRLRHRALVTQLLFQFFFMLLSFKPASGNVAPASRVVKKEFKVNSGFQSVRIEGHISVKLTNDPAGTVIIEGSEKELNKVKPVLENGMLVIDVKRKNMFTKLTLYLSAITLRAIQLDGDANISSINVINSDHLHLSLNGNIRVKVKTTGQLSFDAPDDIELSRKSPFTKRKS